MKVFDYLDINGSGSLSPSDIMNAMRIFGYNAQRKVVYHIISDIDKSESGKIKFDEFIKIMTDNLRPCDGDKQEDYERVFQYFVDDDKLDNTSSAHNKKGNKSHLL